MMRVRTPWAALLFSVPSWVGVACWFGMAGCSTGADDGPQASGGSVPTGGAGVASGGGAGAGSGGELATGGVGIGGAISGGAASGGATSGGAASGGAASGGSTASGGAASGGQSTGGTNTGATAGSDPGGGAGGEGELGVFPEPDCPPPVDLGVRVVGRHDGCVVDAVRIAWSGSGFVARFDGEGLRFTQSGNAVQYTVVVDGELREDLKTTGDGSYEVVAGLSPGEHIVELYRRGEASFGTTTLRGVEVIAGELLAPPAAESRRIEIFGDSITCGYGNEGQSATCSFSADTENHYLTYGAILARHFDADLSTVAWSGKGVVVNYAGDQSTTLPEMLDRAIPESSSSVWDYRLARPPQAVLINLGTNDYSTDNDPADEQFRAVYQEMLLALRTRYPGAHLFCTVGPLLSGSDLDAVRANIAAAVSARQAAGDSAVSTVELGANNPNPGCDYHPSLATHEAMAAELIPEFAEVLGW